MDYETVIRKIVDKQEDTIGMIARQKAKSIEKIEIDGDEINFSESPEKEDVEALMEEYKEIQGQGAVGIARKAMSDLISEDDDIELPEEIIPQDVKKERFASGL